MMSLQADDNSISELLDSARSLIPNALRALVKEKISLHDTSVLYRSIGLQDGESTIDREAYLQSIISCSWHGPYKPDIFEHYLLVSINSDASNEYLTHILVDLDQKYGMGIGVYRWKNEHTICKHFYLYDSDTD